MQESHAELDARRATRKRPGNSADRVDAYHRYTPSGTHKAEARRRLKKRREAPFFCRGPSAGTVGTRPKKIRAVELTSVVPHCHGWEQAVATWTTEGWVRRDHLWQIAHSCYMRRACRDARGVPSQSSGQHEDLAPPSWRWSACIASDISDSPAVDPSRPQPVQA